MKISLTVDVWKQVLVQEQVEAQRCVDFGRRVTLERRQWVIVQRREQAIVPQGFVVLQ